MSTPMMIFVLIVVTIIIFLLCREVVCWYWKLNRIVIYLNKIIVRLDDILEKMGEK